LFKTNTFFCANDIITFRLDSPLFTHQAALKII